MNEALLARIWRAQRFDRDNLRTSKDESVQVVYPGRSIGGPGPDFREAIIQIGSRPLARGDVELHVRASDWQVHGHHQDPAYRDVILHVVLDADATTVTVDGRSVPMLSLYDRIPDPAGLTAIPDVACHVIARRADDASVGSLLDRLGDERLRDKAARLEGELAAVPAEQVLYAAILEALGYNRNRAPFRELAERVPAQMLDVIAHRLMGADRVEQLEALLFGSAGLLPSQRPLPSQEGSPLDWPTATYAEDLEKAWSLHRGVVANDPLPARKWQFAGIRPLNSPSRRIAAAAYLLASMLGRSVRDGFVEMTLDAVYQGARNARDLIARFTVDQPSSYWATHFDFGRALAVPAPRLIGTDRALDLALNVAIPFSLALASHREDRTLADAAWSAYHGLPKASENEVTRRVLADVFGSERARLITTARRQQALLHLDRRVCPWVDPADCPVGQLLG